MWQFITLIFVGLLQIALGFAGIDHHFGAGWAFGSLVVALWLRFLLPITIGSYFGAVDVMGWEWYIGIAVAAPGLLFILPSMVIAALEGVRELSHGSQNPKTNIDSSAEMDAHALITTPSQSQLHKAADNTMQRPLKLDKKPPRETYKTPSISEKEASQIILQYDESVKSLFDQMTGIPDGVKEQVLVAISRNPNQDIEETKKRVILQALGRPDLKWDADLELLIQKCRNAPPHDVDEMFRVFPVLSMRLDIASIRNKFLTPSERIFYTTSATGRTVKITQRGEDVFELDALSGMIVLNTMDEVYEYLGTPPAKRTKWTSW